MFIQFYSFFAAKEDSYCKSCIKFCFLFQGRAEGNKPALWVRMHMQRHLFQLGCFIHQHAGKVLFVGLLLLSTFCVGLKSAKMETDINTLWVEGESMLMKLGKSLDSTNFVCAYVHHHCGSAREYWRHYRQTSRTLHFFLHSMITSG